MAANGIGPSSSKQELPTDAQAIRNVLKTMGVEQHEPRVINMLLDFMYSYVSGVLSDASAFAEQVGFGFGTGCQKHGWSGELMHGS